jgi:GntR family transcriptional regulator
MLDSHPVAIDRTRIPLAIAPQLAELDFSDSSIYATLEAAEAAPVHADVVVSAAAADEARASALCLDLGAPLLVCTTMSYDLSRRLVEIAEIMYRSDRYQFRATLVRSESEQASGVLRGGVA